MTALVSTTPIGQVTTVREMLANQHAAKQLASVAASHLQPEVMMRTLALAVSKTPKLAECTPLSLLGALMTSASLGLQPNTVMGLSYLVPFENRRKKIVEAQLVIGYRGYIQLAQNSGQIASLDAAIHYSDDPVWTWRRGSSAVLDHEQGDMAGDMLHAYAIFETKGGGKTWVVWPEAKLVAHRDRYSKGYAFDVKNGKKPTDANVNIWLSHPDVARMKTMIRQLAKVMPMATEIPRASMVDGARADYAAYALDPSVGSAEIEESDESAVDAPSIGATVEAEAEAAQETAAPAEDGKAALAAAADKLRAKQAPAAKVAPESEPAPNFDSMIQQLRTDLYGWGRSAEQIAELRNMYTAHLTVIGKRNPELRAELEAEIDAYATAVPEDDGDAFPGDLVED